MKKVLIASFVLVAFMMAAVVVHAQDVYPVPGTTNMYKASLTIKAYEPYPAAKEDGKIGRLYGWVGGVDKTKEAKKYYAMKDTKVTKKGGAAATWNDVKADSVVLATYKKVVSKKRGEEADLELTEVEIQ